MSKFASTEGKMGYFAKNNGFQKGKRNIFSVLQENQSQDEFKPQSDPSTRNFTLNGTFTKSELPLISIAYDENDQSLYTGSEDGFIYLWDINSQECSKQPMRHFDFPVTCLILSNEKKQLIASDNNGLIKVFQNKTFKLIYSLPELENGVSAMVLTSDDKTLFIGDDKGYLLVFDMDKCCKTKSIEAHKKKIVNLKLINIEQRLLIVSGSLDCRIRIWDMEDHTIFKDIEFSHPIINFEVNSDSDIVFFAGQDKSLNFWKFSENEPSKILTHAKQIISLAFNEVDDELFCGLKDGKILILDIDTKKVKKVFNTKQACVNNIIFDKENKYIFTNGWDATTKFWTNSNFKDSEKSIKYYKPKLWDDNKRFYENVFENNDQVVKESEILNYISENISQISFLKKFDEELIKFHIKDNQNFTNFVDQIYSSDPKVNEYLNRMNINDSQNAPNPEHVKRNVDFPVIIRNTSKNEVVDHQRNIKNTTILHSILKKFNFDSEIKNLHEVLKSTECIKSKISSLIDFTLGKAVGYDQIDSLKFNLNELLQDFDDKKLIQSTQTSNSSHIVAINEHMKLNLYKQKMDLSIEKIKFPKFNTLKKSNNPENTLIDSNLVNDSLYFQGSYIKGKKNGLFKTISSSAFSKELYVNGELRGITIECNNEYVTKTRVNDKDHLKSMHYKYFTDGTIESGFLSGEVKMIFKNGIRYTGDSIGMNYTGAARLVFQDKSSITCGIKNLRVCSSFFSNNVLIYGPTREAFEVSFDETLDSLVCSDQMCYFMIDYEKGLITKHCL
jgi:WD40 repeat protein